MIDFLTADWFATLIAWMLVGSLVLAVVAYIAAPVFVALAEWWESACAFFARFEK